MVLREFGTLQIRQALEASMAASAYNSTDVLIKEPVAFLFRDCMVAVTLLNGSRFLQLI